MIKTGDDLGINKWGFLYNIHPASCFQLKDKSIE